MFTFVDANGNSMLPSQYCRWEDAVKGLLNVINLTTESSGVRYTLRVTVNTTTGTGIKSFTSEMQVAFYLRHPKVADYAYADGTFDDQYHKDKTVVGMVYKLDPIYQGEGDAEPTVYSGFTKPSDSVKAEKKLIGYRVLVDCI